MLDPGVLIDERHEIQHLLGRGGMAEVFRARDTTTGGSVAIKVLRMVDPLHLSRFRGEIEVLSRLDHPGVVRLLGTGAHDGVPYLVLDLIDGPTLADVLDSGPVGVERSISIGQQLAEALAHAHGLGVVHRDMKPANVIFDAGLTSAHLADFGIARLGDTTRITAAGNCMGTAAYLAPEQLQGQVGWAADVYSLGLVVLECLTGALCYPGTPAETTLARVHRSPAIPPDLPAWLFHTLKAMTARDPRRRPSAGAASDAFRRRSVDPVLASTTEMDAADLSSLSGRAPPAAVVNEATGSGTRIKRGRAARPSRDDRPGGHRLLLAFGGGVVTSIAMLTALALSLVVGPFAGRGPQAVAPPLLPTPTSTTTIQALPIQTAP